ncbi:THO complex subunit 2-like isoform X2 [Macrobrachium nipponense]|uniref:THO complex subunit 2-like isoform X2 n=1 Tax=Macrobrachium nipponense TaxID=159736 RepID=UPI0030C7AB41
MAGDHRLFTPETWKNWDKTGRAEALQVIKDFIQDDPDNPGFSQPEEAADLSRALYEILSAFLKGSLRREHARPFFAEIINLHPDLASQLVEVSMLLDLENSATDRMGKNREPLMALLKSLETDKLLKERLEIETLGEAGVVKNKKTFHTRQIKVKTKLFYKQQKFNLLREETEGYAKLVTELNEDITDRVTPKSMIQIIRSLIGGFNLDPNRVLDLILESLECRPHHHEFYTGLLKLYPCESSTISELLGFKLNSYGLNGRTGKGIYTTIALLIQANILQFSDIYKWLTPEDSSMIEDYQREESEAKEIAMKIHIVSTKDKDKDNKDKEREDDEREREEMRNMEKFYTNQKVQLCIALLEVGAWDNFNELSRRFPDYYLVSCPPISQALCKLIHATIEPMYRKVCVLPSRLKGTVVELINNSLAPPPAYTFEDVCNTIFPMLCALGPHVYHDPGLMYKVLRIAKVALKQVTISGDNMRQDFYYEFLTVLDEVLLPALSVLDSNPCLAEEIWEVLKVYPYQHRYKIYGRWKNETHAQHPILIKAKARLLKKAKFIMMRITKETIKPVSRGIGKLTHNNPGPIFHYILIQVQLYDNLIGPVVDSFKYLTSLSYDMLAYCIVEILSENKDRTANDAMAISPWLQSLSNFCGTVFKKYPMDLGGILQFVANQLKCEKSIDLLILREIVQKMGGIDTLEDLTSEQLDAMCGGELLRREAGQYQQERNIKRSSVRLKEALLENNLAIPLLLLMAQQRSSVVYNQTESPHLKLVGKLYDQCQDTMVQFGSYLFQMVTIDELSDRLPSIGTLLSDCHINADVAFFLARPLFTNMLNLKYDELRRQDRGEKKLTIEQKKKRYLEACNEVFGPIVVKIRPHFSCKVWEDMDPSFFLTFWTLTMSDLEVPTHIYEKEIKKIDINPSSSKRKKDTDRLVSLREKLQEEEKRQKEHVERVRARLQQEKDKWFMLRAARSPKNDTVTAFLQLCLFPRCTFTALDAVYCSKFVKMLHDLKTPNFSTLICYDRMYCDITYTVASCTEQEANRYARFLLGTLETVMHWHASQSNYEKECANYPGFVTKYRVSRQEANDYVDYENYRHVVHKWHYKITKALVTCLESGDYIQIRNAILILQGILSRFPAITNLAAVIEKRIEKVKNQEKNRRNDLYVLANSYSGRLKAAKSTLMPETDFHIVPKRTPPANKVVNGTTEKAQAATNKGDGKTGGEVTENDKEAKVESTEATNGDVDMKEEKRETRSGRKEGDDKKDSEAKKDDKKDDPKKKTKDGKRAKPDEEDEAVEADIEREGSVVSNSSSSSVKMEPPEGSTRGSKRRKTEANSKKEETSHKEHKHKERSKRSKSHEKSRRSRSGSSENSPHSKSRSTESDSPSAQSESRKKHKHRKHSSKSKLAEAVMQEKTAKHISRKRASRQAHIGNSVIMDVETLDSDENDFTLADEDCSVASHENQEPPRKRNLHKTEQKHSRTRSRHTRH